MEVQILIRLWYTLVVKFRVYHDVPLKPNYFDGQHLVSRNMVTKYFFLKKISTRVSLKQPNKKASQDYKPLKPP